MRIRTLAAFGLGATAGTLAGVLAAGVATTAPDVQVTPAAGGDRQSAAGRIALPSPPAVAAAAHRSAALPAFEGCEALRRWYVDAALPDVGPWGFGGPLAHGGPLFATADVRAPVPISGRADTAQPVGASATGTNVQEQGVDEPDIAKTDGHLVVRVLDHHLDVTDVTGGHARQLSRIGLPGPRLDSEELLLLGDTALVVGQRLSYGYWGPVLDTARPVGPQVGGDALTHLVRIDLTTPEVPRVLEHVRMDGSPVAVRDYGDGTVRLVLRTGYPPLDFVSPNRDRSRREATRLNREIVR